MKRPQSATAASNASRLRRGQQGTQSDSWLSGAPAAALRKKSRRPQSAAPLTVSKRRQPEEDSVKLIEESLVAPMDPDGWNLERRPTLLMKDGSRRKSFTSAFQALQPAVGDMKFALHGSSDRIDPRDRHVHSPGRGLSHFAEQANERTRPLLKRLHGADSRSGPEMVSRKEAQKLVKLAAADMQYIEEALRQIRDEKRVERAARDGADKGGAEGEDEAAGERGMARLMKNLGTTSYGRSTPAAVEARVEAKLSFFRSNTDGTLDQLINSIEQSKRAAAIRYIRRLRRRREMAWSAEDALVDDSDFELIAALDDVDETTLDTRTLLQSTIPARNFREAKRTYQERMVARARKQRLHHKRQQRAMARWKQKLKEEEENFLASAGAVKTAERRRQREQREFHEAAQADWLCVVAAVGRRQLFMQRMLVALRQRRALEVRRQRAATQIQNAYLRWRARKAARRVYMAFNIIHRLFSFHVSRWRQRRKDDACRILIAWLGNIKRQTAKGASARTLSRASAIRRYHGNVKLLQRRWRGKKEIIAAQLEALLRHWDRYRRLSDMMDGPDDTGAAAVAELAMPLLAIGGVATKAAAGPEASDSDDDSDDDGSGGGKGGKGGGKEDPVPREVRLEILWDDLRARKQTHMNALVEYNRKVLTRQQRARAEADANVASHRIERLVNVAPARRNSRAHRNHAAGVAAVGPPPRFRLLPSPQRTQELVQKGENHMQELHASWDFSAAREAAAAAAAARTAPTSPKGRRAARGGMIARRRKRR